MRRRPVMRTMARTAVVAGTATAVSGRVARRQQSKFAQQDQAAYEQQPVVESPPPPPPPAAGGLSSDAIEQLKSLGDLKDQGVLTEEEFAAAKSKILGG